MPKKFDNSDLNWL